MTLIYVQKLILGNAISDTEPDGDDDCQVVFEPFSQQQFTSMRGTEGYCQQSYS